MSDKRPLGIFDSGIGGLSVLGEIQKKLPGENLIYVADSKYAPYGTKSSAWIKNRSLAIADFLVQHDVKAIVVACNTATATAIKALRDKYSLPIIGMEPAVKPAALASNTKVIGILATPGTIKSDKFNKLLENFSDKTRIIAVPCYDLVEKIEQGELASADTVKLVGRYITPLLKQNIDQLVLGCTHYPLVLKQIRDIAGERINIVDTGKAVAKHAVRVLGENLLLNNSEGNSDLKIWTSLAPASLQVIIARLFNLKTRVKKIDEKMLLGKQ